MARCGCSSSGASGAAIGAGSCITAAGAGTPASPFVLSPRIDPDSRNLLICGASGLLAADPDSPGSWSSYTPTWSGDFSSGVIGNGLIAAIYRKRGHSLEWIMEQAWGSTTANPSGQWRWSLPPGMACGFHSPVSLWSYAAGSGEFPAGTALASAGETVMRAASVTGGIMAGPSSGFTAGSSLVLGGTIYTTT